MKRNVVLAVLGLLVIVLAVVALQLPRTRWIYCDAFGMSLDGEMVTPPPGARETSPGSGCWELEGPIEAY